MALAVHGLAGLGILSLRPEAPPAPARAIVVTLAAPLTPPRPTPRTAAPPPPVSPARAPAQAAAAAPPAPPLAEAPPLAPTAPPPATPALAAALRGTFGCRYSELLNLSGAERHRCAEQLAAGSDLRGASIGIDPGPRAAFDAGRARENWMQQPFLAMDPKNGCRPKVAYRDNEVPGRQAGDWRVMIGCGISF